MIRSRIVSLVERADAVVAGTICLLVAVSYGAAGETGPSLTSLSTLLAAVPAVKWIVDRAGVSEADARILLGGATATVATGTVLTGRALPVGVALGAVGCWVALDGLYERVHGDDAAGVGAEMGVLTGRRRRVADSLQEASRPLTAPELRDRTGLEGDELEATLEAVARTDPVDRIGNGYALEEGAFDTSAFVSRLVRGVGRRLCRPLGLFGRSARVMDH